MTRTCFLCVFAASFVALAQTIWYRTSVKWYLPFWVSFSPVSFLLMETVTTQNQSFRRLFKLKPMECWLWNLRNVGCVKKIKIKIIYLYIIWKNLTILGWKNGAKSAMWTALDTGWTILKPDQTNTETVWPFSIRLHGMAFPSMTETLSGLIRCNLKTFLFPKL